MAEDVGSRPARTVVASLDRFEGGVAVFEDRDSGDSIIISSETLPEGVRPGDMALIETGESPRVLDLLPDEARAKRDELAARRDRLRERRHGRS